MPIDGFSSQEDNTGFIIGKTYRRKYDIHNKFGGSAQAGIAPCSKYPLIFLFNTPSGKKAGYEDGWVSDDIYYYTGQGQKGDMKFVLGNKAILNHESDGRELHLFSQVEPGNYEYLGQFKYMTHHILDGYDFEHKPRKVIRFTLKKLTQ